MNKILMCFIVLLEFLNNITKKLKWSTFFAADFERNALQKNRGRRKEALDKFSVRDLSLVIPAFAKNYSCVK